MGNVTNAFLDLAKCFSGWRIQANDDLFPRPALGQPTRFFSFQRTVRRATEEDRDGATEAVYLSPELVVIIFEFLYWSSKRNLAYVRCVSQQFNILVSPLVFQNIRLSTGRRGAVAYRRVQSKSKNSWPKLAMYLKLYATTVTIRFRRQEYIRPWMSCVLSNLDRLRFSKIVFHVANQNCDKMIYEAVRYGLSEFVVHVKSPSGRLTLCFAKRDARRAELRSVTTAVDRCLHLKSFGVTAQEWGTVDTLIGDGVFNIEGPRGRFNNIVTLKLDIGLYSWLNRVRPASELQLLNNRLPNLQHFELDFQDDNGLFHPNETQEWKHKLLDFQKLHHLSLKTIPPFIEGTLIEGFVCLTEAGMRKSIWHTGCAAMASGHDRISVYTARSTRVATNVFAFLNEGKEGVPWSRLDFTIKAWDYNDRRQDPCSRKNAQDARASWALACVPKITCTWIKGEPLVQVAVAGFEAVRSR